MNAPEMNALERLFSEHNGRLLQKWSNYLGIYDMLFARYRGTDVHIVEFGVNHGGSLQLWRKYFGAAAKIYGVDINPHCKGLEEPGVEIFIGDQADRSFLRSMASKIPRIDILVDDGGHTMLQQIATFEELFPHVSPTGIYLCEDTHTSYWRKYGGDYKRSGSFIEYTKNLVDQLNAWHSQDPGKLAVNEFTRSVHSITYYDSVVAIQKRPSTKAVSRSAGVDKVEDYQMPMSKWKSTRRAWKAAIKRRIGGA